eukprot:scaffold22023_cov42-Cyclotella_meneghiniana.AAC.1
MAFSMKVLSLDDLRLLSSIIPRCCRFFSATTTLARLPKKRSYLSLGQDRRVGNTNEAKDEECQVA